MTDYIIRNATSNDLDDIYLIYRQLYLSFCSLPFIKREYIEERLFNKEIIVLETDRIIACSHIELLDISFSINTIAVRKEFHNKGFGKILLNYIIEKWLKSKYNEIIVGTFEEYGALDFYLSNGFKIKTTHNDIYNDDRKHRGFLLSITKEEYGKG